MLSLTFEMTAVPWAHQLVHLCHSIVTRHSLELVRIQMPMLSFRWCSRSVIRRTLVSNHPRRHNSHKVKECEPSLDFPPDVPNANKIGTCREESSLQKPKENTDCCELLPCFHETRGKCERSPKNRNGRQKWSDSYFTEIEIRRKLWKL